MGLTSVAVIGPKEEHDPPNIVELRIGATELSVMTLGFLLEAIGLAPPGCPKCDCCVRYLATCALYRSRTCCPNQNRVNIVTSIRMLRLARNTKGLFLPLHDRLFPSAEELHHPILLFKSVDIGTFWTVFRDVSMLPTLPTLDATLACVASLAPLDLAFL